MMDFIEFFAKFSALPFSYVFIDLLATSRDVARDTSEMSQLSAEQTKELAHCSQISLQAGIGGSGRMGAPLPPPSIDPVVQTEKVLSKIKYSDGKGGRARLETDDEGENRSKGSRRVSNWSPIEHIRLALRQSYRHSLAHILRASIIRIGSGYAVVAVKGHGDSS